MKPLYIAAPIAASGLIVAAIVIALWVAGSASGERAKFSSLEVAPRDADVFFALNTDPTSPQWLAVNDSLDSLNAKDPIREAIDEALAEFDLEWERDIVPIAGDEAFFSVPAVTEVDGETGWVAGLLLADEDKAREVFDKLRARAEDEGEPPLEETEYEGVTIYVEESPPGEGLEGAPSSAAIAFIENVLALGASGDDVESVIDVIQGRAPNALENERLQEFREQQKEDFLMWGYADLAPVWDLAESGIATEFGGEGGFSPYPIPTTTPAGPTPAPPVLEADLTIPSFDADYTIGANGSLQVTERIAVDFAAERHGIFRDIPTRQDYDFENDELLEVRDVSVTRDGSPEPFELIGLPDVQQIKIGDPNATIAGAHTYEIKYTVIGGVRQYSPGDDGYYEVTWNATGNRWSAPIESATATFTAPGGFLNFGSCNVAEEPTGYFSAFEENSCQSSVEDLTVRFEADGPIDPGTGMGFIVSVTGDSGAPPPVLEPADNFPSFQDDGDIFVPDQQPFELPFEPEELFDEMRDTYDRVGFSLSSNSDGFAFDLTVLHSEDFDPEKRFEPTEPYDPDLAELLPADTMFYLSVFDVYGQSWLPTKDRFDEFHLPDGSTIDDMLESLDEETGIHLEDDLLALLTGEMALAGNVSGFDSGPEFEVFALADVLDDGKARDTFERIGDYLEEQGLAEVASGDVTEWQPLEDETPEPIGWTVGDGRLIIGYPAASVANAGDGDSLADNADWKRTMELLPGDKTSVGFLSIARILDEVRDVEDAEQEFEDSTNGELSLDDLAPIRSIGFGTTATENGFGFHAVLFMED